MSQYRIAQGKLIGAIDAIEHARLIETVLEEQSGGDPERKGRCPVLPYLLPDGTRNVQRSGT